VTYPDHEVSHTTARARFRLWLGEYLDAARGTDPGEVAHHVRRQGVLAGLDEREVIADLIAYARRTVGSLP